MTNTSLFNQFSNKMNQDFKIQKEFINELLENHSYSLIIIMDELIKRKEYFMFFKLSFIISLIQKLTDTSNNTFRKIFTNKYKKTKDEILIIIINTEINNEIYLLNIFSSFYERLYKEKTLLFYTLGFNNKSLDYLYKSIWKYDKDLLINLYSDEYISIMKKVKMEYTQNSELKKTLLKIQLNSFYGLSTNNILTNDMVKNFYISKFEDLFLTIEEMNNKHTSKLKNFNQELYLNNLLNQIKLNINNFSYEFIIKIIESITKNFKISNEILFKINEIIMIHNLSDKSFM